MLILQYVHKLSFCLLLIMTSLLTGCAADHIRIRVHADHNINLSNGARAHAMVIRFIPLQDRTKLDDLDFFMLKNQPSSLSSEFEHARSMNIAPGETKSVLMPMTANTRYVGVIGYFIHEKNARWRLTLPVTFWHRWMRLPLSVNIDKEQLKAE